MVRVVINVNLYLNESAGCKQIFLLTVYSVGTHKPNRKRAEPYLKLILLFMAES